MLSACVALQRFSAEDQPKTMVGCGKSPTAHTCQHRGMRRHTLLPAVPARIPEHRRRPLAFTSARCATAHLPPPSVCSRRFRPPHHRRSFGSTDTPEGVTPRMNEGPRLMDEISFYSGDDRCAAWHFAAIGEAFAGADGRPCVVMAPGFASTRDTGGLVAYARGFRRRRICMWCCSTTAVSPPRVDLLASWCRRHASARTITRQSLPPGGCPASILSASCCGGSPFSGGHVVRVAAEDARIAAVTVGDPGGRRCGGARAACPQRRRTPAVPGYRTRSA